MPTERPPSEHELLPTDASSLINLQTCMAQAARAAGRAPCEVTLLAVSKGQSVAAIRRLATEGKMAFGENYVQEALPKIAALEGLGLSWHFIGRLQTNKTREVAQHFAWVHSLDRLRLAERLSAQRPDHLPALECCIEINVDGAPSKGGVDIAAVGDLIAAIQSLPRLRLRGFMGMPAMTDDPLQQRAAFRRLRGHLAPFLPTLETLSMGTSGDYIAAIAEGATIVRIGTALFGARAQRGERLG